VKLSVIIPVVQVNLFNNLLEQIKRNTRIPDEFIIIDNSLKHLSRPDTKGRELHFIVPEKRMTVNESWRHGFSLVDKNTDLISVLNDDIIINNNFFYKIENVFRTNLKASIICPRTVSRSDLKKERPKMNRTKEMVKREGWAYTIRKRFLDSIPMIPEDLKTYYGDDWFWFHSKRLGFVWLKMIDNLIFHYKSTSVNKLGFSKTIKLENEIFKREVNKFKNYSI
jgi:hypothetical protein